MYRQDKKDMKLPKSLNDLRRMNQVLEVYIEQHFIRVYTTFITSYI
jgi:hypothetical protein